MTPPSPDDLVHLTYTVVFAVDVLQVVTLLTLAEVAAEGVHTLSVVRAEVLSSYTFINVWGQTTMRDLPSVHRNVNKCILSRRPFTVWGCTRTHHRGCSTTSTLHYLFRILLLNMVSGSLSHRVLAEKLCCVQSGAKASLPCQSKSRRYCGPQPTHHNPKDST